MKHEILQTIAIIVFFISLIAIVKYNAPEIDAYRIGVTSE